MYRSNLSFLSYFPFAFCIYNLTFAPKLGEMHAFLPEYVVKI